MASHSSERMNNSNQSNMSKSYVELRNNLMALDLLISRRLCQARESTANAEAPLCLR